MSFYQGDLLLSNNGNGLTITFTGGQPKLDNGLTNSVLLSLFHKPWFANNIISDDKEHIGSEFISFIVNNPVTISNLNKARSIGLKSLQWMIDNNLASEVDIRLQNPNGSIVQCLVLIKPPADTLIAILATKYGLNWKIQIEEATRI